VGVVIPQRALVYRIGKTAGEQENRFVSHGISLIVARHTNRGPATGQPRAQTGG
jgi:hypothetical protein